MTILLIVMSYRIKNKKYNILWPISFLKIFLPFFSSLLFGQIFLLLETVLDCQDGFSYITKNLICRTGKWFTIEAPLTIIAIVLHIILALITNSLYYKSTFIKDGSDVLKKYSCYSDLLFLLSKIGVNFIIFLDDGNVNKHWAVLVFIIFFTSFNIIYAYYYKSRQNEQLALLNNILCLMPFSGFCSLFIAKIFEFLGFNGAIFMLFSWLIIGIIFILLYKKKELNFVQINYKEIENPEEYINYIYNFYKTIINKENSRSDYTIIKSLISKNEENCLDSCCPLKQYNENDNMFPLLQYCEKLFEFGISKFPNDISLKVNYSFFLISEMNNNKKALIILNNVHTSIFSFNDNYNVYRCKRLIEDDNTLNKNKNINIINSFEYKKKINDFKLLISKATSLYYDFWTLIIIIKVNFTNNIEEVNRIGAEIVKLNKKIEEEYNSLIKIKSDNYDLIKFYSYFTGNILNNQEKYKQEKIKISNSAFSNIQNLNEVQFINFDINNLRNKDLFKYIILSSNKKDFGTIKDFSPNLCPIFGYTKSEIIGNNINILIPALFHKSHNKILFKYIEKSKNKFYKELYNNYTYIPDFIDKQTYAVSKSKFLIPIKLKTYFVQTEGNEFVYIIEITKIKDFEKILENYEENNLGLKCIVLTDDNFYIQSFTANCVNRLKLNDSYINANYNIINHIKQIKNDYIKKINEYNKVHSLNTTIKTISHQSIAENQANRKKNMSNINYIEKKKIKKELIENKYLGVNEITWKINKNDNKNNIKGITVENSIFTHSTLNIKEQSNIFLNNYYENNFNLEIKKIMINKELKGYYFIFKNTTRNNTFIKNDTFSYNLISEIDKNNITLKRKKYYYLFLINPIINNKKLVKFTGENGGYQLKRCSSPRKIIKFKSYDKEDFVKCQKIIKENIINSNKSKNIFSKIFSTKYNTDINNDENKDHIVINETFIPECPFNFMFDIVNYYYKPAYDIKNEKDEKLNEIAKFQALKKLNSFQEKIKKRKQDKNKTEKDEESEESEYEDKESVSSNKDSISQYSINDILSSNIQKISPLQVENNENNSLNNNENNNEHKKVGHSLNKKDIYNIIYKVNLNKIHLSIYDFNKDMVVETTNDKLSKIDHIIKNTKQRLSVEIKNFEEYRNIIFDEYKDDKKKQNSTKTNTDIKKEIITDENSIESKIMEAIDKEEDEDNIIRIYKFSLIGILILIICLCIYLYFQINAYLDYKTLLKIIKDIVIINYSNKIGLYFIRELTLLNIPDTKIKGGQYNILPATNIIEYKSLIRNNFIELFMESQLAMIDFIGEPLSISKESDILLYQTKLITKLSNSENKFSFVKNNIIINIIQLNGAFYNLASSTTPVEQNHQDLYNFIYNSRNNYDLAINLLIDTFIKELTLKTETYQLYLQIQLYVYFVVYILVYISYIFLYSKIIKRKKIYMNVFFDLNYDFITYSINKCDEFTNKFKFSEEYKNQEEDTSKSYEEKRSLNHPEKHFKDSHNNLKGKSINMGNDKIKDKYEWLNNLVIKIIFASFLLIIYIFYYLYGFFYLLNLNKLSNNIASYYYHLQNYHLNIVEYFNLYREYLFDNGTYILNTSGYQNLVHKEREIYSNWTNDINNITYYRNKYIKDKEKFNLLNKPLCSYNMTDIFESQEDCMKSIGIGYDQNIDTFITCFFDEIRIKKNAIRMQYETGVIIGNLTEYNTNNWYNKYYNLLNNGETNEKYRFRLDLFNDFYFHTISNIHFINIVLPCFNERRKIILGYLSIEGKHYAYFILISVFVVIILGIYFFYWIPTIKRLNRVIYETKNMLKIIPMHILIADINIKNLLHISLKK